MKVDAYDYVDEVEGCFALDGFENQLVVLFFVEKYFSIVVGSALIAAIIFSCLCYENAIQHKFNFF
ncbi:hypothetical protein SDC9_168909 [bioreactor metagenome]|uniref:Uncharacterized protein n=1 Tax=bioreactor metagenome TaxID=1076179 RepID=A0A645G6U7_9ZZZZ